MKYLLTILLFASITVCAAQADYTKDVQSLDAIVATLYGVISGEPGQTRDWARFKNLFKPESRLIPTRKADNGELTLRALTPDEYIELFSSRVTSGFHEKEIHRLTEQYGTVTHLFSTYETREKINGPVTNRGINSIQLFHDGKRFYIINIFWCPESAGFSIPEKYEK